MPSLKSYEDLGLDDKNNLPVGEEEWRVTPLSSSLNLGGVRVWRALKERVENSRVDDMGCERKQTTRGWKCQRPAWARQT